jgi:tetratricopeptide (TPR) repeat protein
MYTKRVLGYVLPVCVLSTLASVAFSQIGGGLSQTSRTDFGGRSYIVGIVFAPSGMPVRAGVRVRVSAPTVDVLTTTDGEGKFSIGGLSNGIYTVTVDAYDRFENESQQVEIAAVRASRGQTYFVQVRLREKGRPDKASVVNADLAGVPKKALQFYQKGVALAAEGNNRGAVEEFLAAVREHREFMLAHTQLGISFQKLNELEKADKHLQEALRISPDSFDALANRGIVLVRLKRFAEAETPLRATLQTRPEFAVSHYYLGRALAGLKRLEEAEAAFKEAFALGGAEMIEARRGLAGIYLEKGELRNALAELEAYLAAVPSAPDAPKLRETAEQLRAHLGAAVKKPER